MSRRRPKRIPSQSFGATEIATDPVIARRDLPALDGVDGGTWSYGAQWPDVTLKSFREAIELVQTRSHIRTGWRDDNTGWYADSFVRIGASGLPEVHCWTLTPVGFLDPPCMVFHGRSSGPYLSPSLGHCTDPSCPRGCRVSLTLSDGHLIARDCWLERGGTE